MGNNLILPTLGGTASNLNYYEEYDFTSTWTWGASSTSTSILHFTRVGRLVTLVVLAPIVKDTGNYCYGTFPSRFIPQNGLRQFITIDDGSGHTQLGQVYINLNPNIYLYWLGITTGGILSNVNYNNNNYYAFPSSFSLSYNV